ncbi:AAA family ATPase [Viridibacillus arvi]|uniref:AAA family ATPase n=1 Tax=Viridibacillus arvi TaxID=263475 RepID=UPI003D2678B2
MALNAAHKGYIYQDLVTACFFVRSIVDGYDEIAVDKKYFKGDALDDITTYKDGKSIRSQFKYSENRMLEIDDLKKKKGSIRLRDIFQSHIDFTFEGEKEYRVCLAWDEPIDKELLDLLELVNEPPTFEILKTKCYKIIPEKLWPENSVPVWEDILDEEFTRDTFLELCEMLIIELEWPKATLDLTLPGELERFLIESLEQGIGIGRYPNEDRNPVDIAATLIRLATICRSQSRSITPLEIINQIGIRTDFGRVAQKNIVDYTKYVNRSYFLEEIKQQINVPYTVLIGSPGSGKSWILSMLYEELKKQEYLVARHYCYLEPGDQDVQRRITSNALFGNLISELVYDEESLLFSKKSLYSADEDELNRMLETAASNNRKVYLIIDGLDHISRVFNSATNLTKDEVDIIEKISMLKIPSNVHIILGSQPGNHLSPLENIKDINFIEVPIWEIEDIKGLFNSYSLKKTITSLTDSPDEFYFALKEKTEGNPLYITFLAKRIVSDISARKGINLEIFLKELPPIDGDIKNYYDYLFSSTEDLSASFVGDVLALVDFGLTEKELKEIFPQFSRHIRKALDLLSPILINVSSQGGVRIYHESFRRYVSEKLDTEDTSIADIIGPVIEWLKHKGFYLDAKAYQFLPSMLKRAGKLKEIESLVDKNFVVHSVAYCHPQKAIEQNLIISAYVARGLNDYRFYIRLNELKKSLYTCYNEKLSNVVLYGKSFASLYGYDVLAQRLILDGRITFDVKSGLLLCVLIDENNVVAPWEEYCEAYSLLEDRNDLDVELASFRGFLKISDSNDAQEKIINWFKEQDEKTDLDYIRGLLQVLTDLKLEELLYTLLNMNMHLKDVIRLHLMKSLQKNDKSKAIRLALKTNIEEASIEEILLHIQLGREIDLDSLLIENPQDINISIGSNSPDTKNVSAWIESIRFFAWKNIEVLEGEKERVSGEGWYKKWLRFNIEMAKIEANYNTDGNEKESKVIKAFRLMENEESPFLGEPRACDLYSIESLIFISFMEAIKYVKSANGWRNLVSILENISRKTTTYLMGSPSGPLVSIDLMKILSRFADEDNSKEAISKSMERLNIRASNKGEFFEIQAEHEMYYSMIMKKVNNEEEAISSWERVARFLTAYGFHKDVTIYELLDGAEYLIEEYGEDFSENLIKLLPLLNKIIVHTDGKEIRNIHNIWFQILLKIKPNLAIRLLARSLKIDGGRIDWRLEDALQDVLETDRLDVPNDMFIMMTLALNCTISNNKILYKSLTALKRLNGDKSNLLYDLIKAKIFEKEDNEEAKNIIEHFETGNEVLNNELSKNQKNIKKIIDCIVFPYNANPIEIIYFINELSREDVVSDRFINGLGYRLVEYIQLNEASEVQKILDILARKLKYSSREMLRLFKALMEGFERHGFIKHAIYLAILQYTRVYEMSWKAFGGKEILKVIEGFYKDYPQEVESCLQSEIVYFIEQEGVSFGLTSNLIYLFRYINPRYSLMLWEEAYEIINLRLKTEKEFSGPFLNPMDIEETDNLQQGCIELILSRICHPELKRKSWAITGAYYFYYVYEDVFLRAINQFIRIDISNSVLEIALSILAEKNNTSMLQNIDELNNLVNSPYYTIRELSKIILDLEGNIAFNFPNLSKTLQKETDYSVLILDKNKSAINVEEILPGTVKNTISSFLKIFESDITGYKARMRDRMDVFRHRSRKLPLVDYWGFENELFKQVLNEEVSKYVDSNPVVLTRLLSDIRIPVSLNFSRVYRPKYIVPSRQKTEIFSSIQKSKICGFENWIKIASVETELVLEDDYFSNIQSISKVFLGTVISKLADYKENLWNPVETCDVVDWWHIEETTDFASNEDFEGALAMYCVINNELGEYEMLKLNDRISKLLNLRPLDFPNSYKLIDEDKNVGVVLKCWQQNPIGNDLNEELFKFKGLELIMRPDLYKKMNEIIAGEIYQMSIIE